MTLGDFVTHRPIEVRGLPVLRGCFSGQLRLLQGDDCQAQQTEHHGKQLHVGKQHDAKKHRHCDRTCNLGGQKPKQGAAGFSHDHHSRIIGRDVTQTFRFESRTKQIEEPEISIDKVDLVKHLAGPITGGPFSDGSAEKDQRDDQYRKGSGLGDQFFLGCTHFDRVPDAP